MKTISKFIRAFVLGSVDFLAPFTVQNVRFHKLHYCWSFKEACEWLKCYDSKEFGVTLVYNFNGDPIASKGM